MKVKTNLKAGGYVQTAEDQAEQFFRKTDQALDEARQKIGQAASSVGHKISQVWNCAIRS
jgi:prefoldin subunit 5